MVTNHKHFKIFLSEETGTKDKKKGINCGIFAGLSTSRKKNPKGMRIKTWPAGLGQSDWITNSRASDLVF